MTFLREFINLFFWAMEIAILIRVLLSWVPNLNPANAFVQLVFSITEPVLCPARRLLPAMGGLDISPIIVLFALQLLQGVLLRIVS